MGRPAPYQRPAQQNHRNLAQLYAHVEGNERAEIVLLGQPQARKSAGEPHAVHQPKPKHYGQTPRVQPVGNDVFNGYKQDGKRNDRLNNGRRRSNEPVHGQPQRNGVRHRERCGLHEHRLQARLQNVEAKDKKDVVEPQRDDVREAQLQVRPKNFRARELAKVRIQDVRRGGQRQQSEQEHSSAGAAHPVFSPNRRGSGWHVREPPAAFCLRQLLPCRGRARFSAISR